MQSPTPQIGLNKRQALVFSALNARLCLYLMHIDKVLPLMQLEILPTAHPSVAGLMNLSGKSIPVMDLGMFLGLKRCQTYSIDTSIILCTKGEDSIGLIVDKILGPFDNDMLQTNPSFDKTDSPFLGTLETPYGLALLINPKWLFNLDIYNKNTDPIDSQILSSAQNEKS